MSTKDMPDGLLSMRIDMLWCYRMSLSFLMLLFIHVNVRADSKSGSNSADYSYTQANVEIWSPITISGAPSGAVISSVVVHWNVDSNYTSDIDYYLDNSTAYDSAWYDMSKTGDDWLDGYNETSDASRTFYPPAGTQVNGTWYFNIKDAYNDSDPNWNKGRIDSWDITINYTNETTPPTTPGTPDMLSSDDSGQSSSDNLTNDTSIRFDWTASTDSGSGVKGYWWAIDDSTPESGGNWTTNNYCTGVNPGEGNHTIYVKAEDNAGNRSGANSLFFTIDRTSPNAPTPTAPSGDVGTLTPTITWNTNGSWKYQARIEHWDTIWWWDHWVSGEVTGGSVSVPGGQLSWEGSYRSSVRACDAAGNWSGYGTTVQFRPHDVTAPSNPGAPDMSAGDDSGQSSSDNLTNDTSIRFDWTASTDSGSGVKGYWWAIDDSTPESGGNWTTNNYCTGVNPGEGNHTIYVKAEDNASPVNRSGVSSLSFTIDRTAPGASTPTAPSGDIGTLTPTITWNTNGSWKYQARIEHWDTIWWWDHWVSGEVTGGSVSVPGGQLSWEESYRSSIRACDAAGNWSGYGTTVQFRPHDVTAPSNPGAPDMSAGDDSGQSSSDNLTNDSSIRFDWTASTDGGSGVKGYWWAIDDSTPESGGNWTTNNYCTGVNPGEGNHTIYVKAEDNASPVNRSGVSSLSFTIDRTAPGAPTPTAPSGDIGTLTPTITWNTNGSWKYQAKVERYSTLIWWDIWTSAETTGNSATVPAGLLSWGDQCRSSVRACDAAGNWSGYGTTVPFRPVISPVITSMTPSMASAGTNTNVTINGNSFGSIQGSSKVYFFYQDGEPEIEGDIVSWSDSQIVCKVPVATINRYAATASSGPVKVVTSLGTSNEYVFKVTFSYMGSKWVNLFGAPVAGYRINENSSDCTGEAAAVRNAANTWNSAGAAFSFKYEGTHTKTSASFDVLSPPFIPESDILWATVTDETGDPLPNVIAAAYTYIDPFGMIVERDLVFNNLMTWSTNSTPPSGQYDVQSIALHELGHWLALRDLYGDIGDGQYDSAKIMCGFGSTGVTKRNLHADDIAGIRWIYGESSLRAVVWDAWWSNPVDNDGDGYKRSARLNWDPDVSGGSGSLTIYEKIYWKPKNSSSWNLLATTTAHTINDTSTADSQYRDVSGGNHDEYDWKIEVYRNGITSADYVRDPSNDPYLDNYAMETAQEDSIGQDPWDSGDDSWVSPTVLTAPTITEQTHGPHSLSATDLYDWFKIHLTAGEKVNFNTAGGSGNTYAELSDAKGVSAAVDDNGAGSGQFSVTYTPIVSGDYFLRVRGNPLGTNCSYSLKYRIVTPNPVGQDSWDPRDNTWATPNLLPIPTLSERSVGPFTLSSSDSYDWFKIYLTARIRVNFNTIGGSGDNYVELNTDKGVFCALDDNSGNNGQINLTYTPLVSGYYFLRIRSKTVGNNCAYTLKYRAITPPIGQDPWDPKDDSGVSPNLLPAATTSERAVGPFTLSSSDKNDWFKIYLTAGSTINFNSIGGSGNNRADLYTYKADFCVSNDNGGGNLQFSLTYTATIAGYYCLKVHGNPDGTACTYSLKYRLVSSPGMKQPDQGTGAKRTAVETGRWLLYE